jgi:hypothetical protein
MNNTIYDIYFGNSANLTSDDRMVQAFDTQSMYATFDALSKAFLHVIVWRSDGAIVREYNNI